MAGGMIAFQLFSCTSRRALGLAGVNRAALGVLPMHLRPTLLINQPDLPRSTWQLWLSSNHRGLHVPGKAGAVLDCVCSKQFFWARRLAQTLGVAKPYRSPCRRQNLFFPFSMNRP